MAMETGSLTRWLVRQANAHPNWTTLVFWLLGTALGYAIFRAVRGS